MNMELELKYGQLHPYGELRREGIEVERMKRLNRFQIKPNPTSFHVSAMMCPPLLPQTT